MGKYDFQKASQFPYLDYVGYKVLTRLKKRHFQCKSCRKMLVSET
ncbi:Mobile element protein [Streptococcus sp. DD10]|nr:Mobile element protein [Streptococcus sp. DD10]